MTKLGKRHRAQVVELLDERLPPTFWNKVMPEPNSGCWLWTGALNSYGYGAFRIDKRQWPAHRFALSLIEGDQPTNVHVDHLCRVTYCVNPAHLEFVSVRENARRGIKGVLTTHCPAGHEYDEANTRTGRDGKRHCRACETARSSARWKREKAEAAARVEEGSWP